LSLGGSRAILNRLLRWKQAGMEDNQHQTPVETAEIGEIASDQTGPVAPPIVDRDELAQQQAQWQDRFLRLQAEFENFRKRIERERMEFAEYAGEQTIRNLLPVVDDLERAIKAAREAGAENDFVKGVELIHSRLLETLKRQGLEPISSEGAKFDPHLHEAINRAESTDHDDGTILQEYQRGYNFKGRLLRPAMVQVAVHP
jgi:molecular chaperone GrpE